MVTIQISINLDVNEPAQAAAQLAAILQGAQLLTPQTAAPAVVDDAPAPLSTNSKRRTGRPKKKMDDATSPAPRRRKQLPELLDPKADWAFYDGLVRNEMRRLSVDRRMPGTALWNNERDCRLPTMAGLVAAYDVADVKELATKLNMPAPLSTMAAGG